MVDPSVFTITVVCKDPKHLERAEAIVREELANLAEVNPDQLERTQSAARYAWLTGLENPGRVASTLGWFLRRHPNVAGYETWWNNYTSVDPAQIAEVAARTFVDERLTIGTLEHTAKEAE